MAQVQRLTYIDKLGDAYDMGPARDEDRALLIQMYECFVPKAVTQGLPPANPDTRLEWILGLLADGENFLAWQEGKVVGHCSLILDESMTNGEYLIFVSNTHRNRGLGTGLTAMAVERARELGLDTIWLTVEALNFRAIKLYKKIGFVFCDSGERERIMILRL
ncbi:GNAT family N-acetyltransferase [Desulfomonile tiedjei]|uniref:Sortase-like acyltransferase n=1 Tax=Desulfomonile tiedjei (strain ATCC 49306 / DSM 6799 / DCB-1) TaxID=706587 RepID=I4C642_DESTA|nr:GNAT family N-acetyltransferase [Desulfomonile tiedjei]AFM25033.1 sortase-like acyltransferase [Desulfomonile tiedjei DSM 6799]